MCSSDLKINGNNSRWAILDDDTATFRFTGKNVKHIVKVLKSKDQTFTIENGVYSKSGFKESLQKLKTVCPSKKWNGKLDSVL